MFEAKSSLILENARGDCFAGFDPFDGLNSRLFDLAPCLKQGFFGLAWTQLHKRSFVNLRPLLGVPKARNPKGIGLFVLGLIEDYQRTGLSAYLEQAVELGDWLLLQQSDRSVWSHACWGYHFDWNARAFYVPKGKPNIITTVYVARALYALGAETGDLRYSDAALDAASFIVESLYVESSDRKYFAYIPGEDAFVHNASLWGAAWVAFVGQQLDDNRLKELALLVARQSVVAQGSDGSWVYGTRHHHGFIDGFHTGYNLEALDTIRTAIGTTEFDQSIALGLTYYKTQLVEVDGTAKYYHNNAYPLDMHSVTQVVITLLKVGGASTDVALSNTVIERALQVLYDPKLDRFIYQRHRIMSNKIDYMRWTQAWAYYSLSLYNRIAAEKNA